MSETIPQEIPPATQGYCRKFAFPFCKVLLFWTDNLIFISLSQSLWISESKRENGCSDWPPTSFSWSLSIKSEKTNNSLLKDVCLTGSPPCHLLWSLRAIQLFHQSTPALPALLCSGAAAWVHLSLLYKEH